MLKIRIFLFYIAILKVCIVSSNKELLICDFNNATSGQNACGGTFTNNANGNAVGIYETLQIDSNEITDYSSICKYF